MAPLLAPARTPLQQRWRGVLTKYAHPAGLAGTVTPIEEEAV